MFNPLAVGRDSKVLFSKLRNYKEVLGNFGKLIAQKRHNLHLKRLWSILTPTMAAWPLRGHTALKSILRETLFLNQLHDFSLLSVNSFLHPVLKSKFMRKNSLTPKKIHFRSPIFINIYLIKPRSLTTKVGLVVRC